MEVMLPKKNGIDALLVATDEALRTLSSTPRARRMSPADSIVGGQLSPEDRTNSIRLMRVNHSGEISAQALYRGQSIFARSAATQQHLLQAASEEEDHLAWCSERLNQLGGQPSLLDPLWYTGSFFVGLIAGAAGDNVSLGFVAETERQVEAHLEDHLSRVSKKDIKSVSILKKMAQDEAHHGTTATLAGGINLPPLIRSTMALGGGFLRRLSLLV
jgi:3-demethoxyubiquinol 3-hydroxylase